MRYILEKTIPNTLLRAARKSRPPRTVNTSKARMNSSPPPKRPRLERESVAAFIFRRDFRIRDNTALNALHQAAKKESLPILPLFFFNPVQADKKKNPYFGDACFQFMCESLADLDEVQLDNKLVCLRGTDTHCMGLLHIAGLDVRMVGYNEDFTPFALQRDQNMAEWCEKKQIALHTSDRDFTLLPLDTIKNASGHPYSVFTPFYNAFMGKHAKDVAKVSESKVTSSAFYNEGKARLRESLVCPSELYTPMPHLADHGGRKEGLRRMKRIPSMTRYIEERDFMGLDSTSHLSPHLKFGTVSIREVWECAVSSLTLTHGFVRQLIWREFYAMLLYNHPRLAQGQLVSFGKAPQAPNDPFMAKYHSFKWKWRDEDFSAFVEGRTGVPLVDAAVRCVTATGWCHNRARMVIANFLVKVLFVDWREGERWFATVATDYDVANNSGGWLWSSGQGADPQPYFRTFNPFRQTERFDPECAYVYQWVPELRHIPPSVVHKWDTYCAKSKHQPCSATEMEAFIKENGASNSKKKSAVYPTTYPAPIVNIPESTKKVIAIYKQYD